MRLSCENRFDFAAEALVIVLTMLSLAGCRPAASPDAQSDRPESGAPAATPLPTRQTTIDPVAKKLDAAQQDLERRRAEADQVGK